MSFVIDQVRRIDGHLDRLASQHLSAASTLETEILPRTIREEIQGTLPRILELQQAIKSLSAVSRGSTPLASPWLITNTLSSAGLSSSCSTCSNHDLQASKDLYLVDGDTSPTYEHQLEWMLLCKATAQTYGAVLNTILNHTLELSEHDAYWDEILGSHRWVGVYSLQTAPLRLWSWTKGIILDVRMKKGRGLEQGWRQFYGLVKEVVRERSVVELQARVLSLLARVREEARRKQKELRRLKEVNSNALAFLLGEGLSSIEEAAYDPQSTGQDAALIVMGRRDNVAKSIVLMETVLSQVEEPDIDVDTFEERISATTGRDVWLSSLDNGYSAGDLRPSEVSTRLQSLLNSGLPKYSSAFNNRLVEFGQPSRIIRYWLPTTVFILFSSTILRILVNRKEEVFTWIREFGSTVRDFWINWVVDPTRKVIGTIRHDEGSEVAIISKRSLEGDRESLERMVVDFMRDNPENGTALNEAQLLDVRMKIREGDLTPVLKAYEQDIKSPVKGALRGTLVRTLLIQVQKRAVDVEVAIGGIDSLLKSQELVFGFVGLTPGILIVYSVLQWLNNTFVTRKGSTLYRKKGRMLGSLRNIDRILVAAHPSKAGVLYYKDYGLLLCEAHVLRQWASKTFPYKEFRDFLVDLEELTDMQIGVERQMKVVKRMRWGYSTWL